MDILADLNTGENDTVLHDSALLDGAATSDYGALNGALDLASIGDHRFSHVCALVILGRTGVVGSDVDRPVICE